MEVTVSSINPANNRISSSSHTYDSNGNLTAMPGSTVVYDIENRTVQVTSSGSEYYGYDPWNRGKNRPLLEFLSS